jgi:hypothetical protein
LLPLEARKNLSLAQRDELKNVIEYNKMLTLWEKTTGVVLERFHSELQNIDLKSLSSAHLLSLRRARIQATEAPYTGGMSAMLPALVLRCVSVRGHYRIANTGE